MIACSTGGPAQQWVAVPGGRVQLDEGKTMANEHVQTFTDGNFDDSVLKAGAPVLVDFWAEWCGPCKAIAPALEDLAKDMAGKLTVAKINIDENPSVPSTYRVRGIPTLILFKDGQIAATKIGSLPKSKLYEWIQQVVVQPT
jgi:thioredoxin 1